MNKNFNDNNTSNICETEHFIYHQPEALSKEQLVKIFSSKDIKSICFGLISMAFYENDLNFCFKIIEDFSKNENEYIRGNAVLCIGHLARIHKTLHENLIQIVKKSLNDPSKYVRGHAESALDDIDIYISK